MALLTKLSACPHRHPDMSFRMDLCKGCALGWNQRGPICWGWICSNLLQVCLKAQAVKVLIPTQALVPLQLSLETAAEAAGQQTHSMIHMTQWTSRNHWASRDDSASRAWWEWAFCSCLKQDSVWRITVWKTAQQWEKHCSLSVRSLRLGQSVMPLEPERQQGATVKRRGETKVTHFFHSQFYLMFWANKFSSRQCYFNCWKQAHYSLTQSHPKNEKGIEAKVREPFFRNVCCAKRGEPRKWANGTAEMSLFLHTSF